MTITAHLALARQDLRPIGARIRFNAGGVHRLRYRRFHRARLAVTVLTVVGPHEATIRGVSLYGACIDGGRRLRRREMVALRLPSGDRITARVRWRLGMRSGIVFASPVADFARLIGEGALVQSPHRRRRGRTRMPLSLGAAERVAEADSAALDRLRGAISRAWAVIERAITTRAARRSSLVRRLD